MIEVVKRGRGQPRKRPTFIKSIRVEKDIKEFLESLENANYFLVLQIKNTKEFKDFQQKQFNQNSNPKLPFLD